MKGKILIIDDEKDLCELIRQTLVKENYEVQCAYDLKDAGQKLAAHPQIVLLDNNLPDGSGLDFLRMHPVEFFNCTVIMMTADSTPNIKLSARIEGVAEFIEKPFSVRYIKDVLNRKTMEANN